MDENQTPTTETEPVVCKRHKQCHSFYLQTTNSTDLMVLGSLKELRKAVSQMDQSQIVRIIKGYEKNMRTETKLVI